MGIGVEWPFIPVSQWAIEKEKKNGEVKICFSKVVTFLETFPQSSAVRYGGKNSKKFDFSL